MKHLFCIAGALLIFSSQPALADYERLIQAFVGGWKLDDQKGDAVDDNGEAIDIEFPTMPLIGLEGEYQYGGDYFTWGINPGGSLAWKSSGTNISGGYNSSTGGKLRIEIENSLFIGELHLGGYLRARLGEQVTVYAAAGPTIMYGRMKVEDDDEVIDDEIEIESGSVSDYGFGFYGRAGIDFSIRGEQSIGLGLRYFKSELDFGDSVGNIDIEGPQVIFSYTVPL